MTALRNQVLFLLALTLATLLAAKTLVDGARVGARIEQQARIEGRIALLQAGPLVERAYSEGHLGEVRQVLSRLGALSGNSRAALLDAGGTVLAASDPKLEGRAGVEAGLVWAADVAALPAPEPASRVADQTLMAAAPVHLRAGAPDPLLTGPPVPAAGSAALAYEVNLAPRFAAATRAVAIENGVAALVALAMLFVIAAMLRLQLGDPARRVAETLEQFDAGDRGARTGLKGRTEIARIGKAFDALADRLQATENDLLDAQVRLDRVFQSLPIGVMVVRRDDGRPFFANPRWRELFGIPNDAARDILSLLSTLRCERTDGKPYPIERLPIPTVLRTGEPAEARDLCVRRDDSVLALAMSAWPANLSGSGTFDAVVALASELHANTPLAAPALRPAESPERVGSADFATAVASMESVGVAPFVASPTETAGPERETVLLAEGEPRALELSRRALEGAGYRVMAAGDGDRAMVFFGRHGPTFRAVVVDLGLNGPSGEMLLDEILALDPLARVVAISGYRPDLPRLAASGKIAAFLTRPYREERLLATVRQAMHGPIGVEPMAGA